MREQLRRAGMPGPLVIGIDEISVKHGQDYRIVVSDLLRRRAIWFGGTDRKEESMDLFYQVLGAKKSSRIRLAVMDMWIQNLKQHQVRERFGRLGAVSGVSFAAPRKPREPICWQWNGPAGKLFRLSWRMYVRQLRALDLQLEISRRTLDSRRESLRLTRMLADGGATSLLDVRQAEQLVFTASAEIPVLEQQISQQENFLSILVGQNPGDVPRGRALTEQRQPPEVPSGLPSALLERRPDIRQAEEQLIAANAEIGVARAAYFPQISLSATSGFQSSALSNLFTGPAGAWSFGASLTQPIFAGGRLRSGVRLAEAREQTALLVYQQSIQGAFRSVSDALVAYRKTREFRVQEELLFESAQDAARLSHMRYTGGVTGCRLDERNERFHGRACPHCRRARTNC